MSEDPAKSSAATSAAHDVSADGSAAPISNALPDKPTATTILGTTANGTGSDSLLVREQVLGQEDQIVECSQAELAVQNPSLLAAYKAPDPLPSHTDPNGTDSASASTGETSMQIDPALAGTPIFSALDSASAATTAEATNNTSAVPTATKPAEVAAAPVTPIAPTVPVSGSTSAAAPLPPIPAAAEQFTGIDVKSRSRAARGSLGRKTYAEPEEEEEEDDGRLGHEIGDGDSFQGDRTSDSEDVDDDSDESDFVDDENAVAATSKKRKGRKGNKKKKKKSTKKLRLSARAGGRGFSLEGTPIGDGDDVSMSETASAVAEGRGARRGARDRFIARFGEDGDDSDASNVAGGHRNGTGRERSALSNATERNVVEDFEYSQLPQLRHRTYCAKCHQEPVPVLMKAFKAKKKKDAASKKKRRHSRKHDSDIDEDTDQEEDRVSKLGAWFKCAVCIDAYHFQCLPGALRKEFVDDLKHEHFQDHLAKFPPLPLPPVDPADYILDEKTNQLVPPPPGPPVPSQPLPQRVKIEEDARQIFELRKCWTCKKRGGRRCLGCGVSGRKWLPPPMAAGAKPAQTGPVATVVAGTGGLATSDAAAAASASASAVSARQITANTMIVDDSAPPSKAHSPAPDAGMNGKEPEKEGGLMFRCGKCRRAAHYECLDYFGNSIEESADSYYVDGHCHDCYKWNIPLDVILAWAEDDVGPTSVPDPIEEGDIIEQPAMVEKRDNKTGQVYQIPSAKDPSARAKYLVKWQNESYRQLDWVPHAFLVAAYPAKLKNFLERGSTVNFDLPTQDDPEDDEDPNKPRELPIAAPLPDPNAIDRIPKSWSTVDRILDLWYHARVEGREPVHWRNFRNGPEDPEESIKMVARCYFKWCDLPYGSSTLEAPLDPSEDGYEEFKNAYKRFLSANAPEMRLPALTAKQMEDADKPKPRNGFVAIKEQPSYIVGGALMPFQVEGVNFMYYQWWKRTGCILADEMGLGKTVQIVTFLSVLHHQEQARPFLVTVPNSTIGNWVREFERWAPSMRVVPYSGDGDSRQIIEDYEMFDHKGALKTHVVLATYEALEKNIQVFQRVTRWECLVVDEGQRLKSGKNGLLFVALQSLRINHRILLSGTPLNNNLEELFNLLHFIDPTKWDDMEMLSERYAELTPEKVEEVRQILKPYFLRRTKDLVLNLPPLTDIVVPVSMSVLQRQIYRSVLERNAAAIESIFQKTAMTKKRKTSFNNVLMELRKVLCHPYIIAPEIEPRGVGPQQELANLTEASAKFVLLSKLLPKLKAAGHRVLIFSQFKIVLNIIEPFLQGMKLKYLRLDGDTKQLDRQRGIDEFNAPDSDCFCYLLSTRAGGVGINLTTADTVIMFDQDFNPHQDIQAISRAHRIGQKKPVRVFKLLVKGTCEEKIFQAGTRKLGLDHLIIQRIDAKDETEDVETILQYGAKAIFDDKEAEASAIRYTDAEIDELLMRSAEPLQAEAKSAAGAFAQAKIWERGGLDDVNVDGEEQDENLHGFWSTILQQQEEAERLKRLQTASQIGRGKRSRGPATYQTDTPAKNNKRRRFDDDDSDSEAFVDEDGYRSDSGDDFRPVNPMDRAVDRAVRDSARLDGRPERPVGVGFGMKLGRRGREKLSPASRHAADAARRKRRSRMILGLAAAAAAFNDDELDDLLSKAANAIDRIDQTQLMEEATKKLVALHEQWVPPKTTDQGPSGETSAIPPEEPVVRAPSVGLYIPENQVETKSAEGAQPNGPGVKEEIADSEAAAMPVDTSASTTPAAGSSAAETKDVKPTASDYNAASQAQELYDLFKPKSKQANGEASTSAAAGSRTSPRKDRSGSAGDNTPGSSAGFGTSRGVRSTRGGRQSLAAALAPGEGDDGSEFGEGEGEDDEEEEDSYDEDAVDDDDDDDVGGTRKSTRAGPRKSKGKGAKKSKRRKAAVVDDSDDSDEE